MKLSRGLGWVVLLTVSWLAACGGTSSRGRGGGGGGSGAGEGMAKGGSKTGTDDPSSSSKSGSGLGGAAAATGGKASVPGTGGESVIRRCTAAEDCPGLDEPCERCEDGSVLCNTGFCDEATGMCKRLGNVCPAKCVVDSDCPELNLACTECNDGTRACPTNECVGGRCHTTYPGCSGYDPCKDRNCGYYCTSCGPDEDCGVGALSFCDDRGKCRAGLGSCGASSCDTAMDCGAPPPDCVACTNDTCAVPDCVDNQCVLACPPDTTRLCKDTLECPIPPGPCTKCPNGACAVPACLQSTCELVCPL